MASTFSARQWADTPYPPDPLLMLGIGSAVARSLRASNYSEAVFDQYVDPLADTELGLTIRYEIHDTRGHALDAMAIKSERELGVISMAPSLVTHQPGTSYQTIVKVTDSAK